VSESLKADTYRALQVRAPIAVIPNFLDCGAYNRRPDPSMRARLCPPDRYDALVLHASNFRPVKRVNSVIEIFRGLRRTVRTRLALVGDGPDLEDAMHLASADGLDEHIVVLGEQYDMVPILSVADLFLLPSAQESFGLAALEAMACGVPVVASRIGGLPEVITDAVDGFLRPVDDIRGMVDAGAALLGDPVLRRRIADEAVRTVRERFCMERIVPLYEEFYRTVTNSRPAPSRDAAGRT
jgi:N-acetyl-alpha-D-glucosaminyl L-malate synthase BshA